MATSASSGTPTVLVVDDHPPNLLALEATLEPLGYQVVRSHSGEEALKALSEHDIVLILMDVHMPGLDGYQTMAMIREREQWQDIPVIFLSAIFNDLEHTHRGYALGAVDYIAKPFDPTILRAKVRSLGMLYMRGRRAEQERSREAERIKDLFLGAVGHDLRNPLNAITFASMMMLRRSHLGVDDCRLLAEKVARAGQRMHRIVEDILDLTRREFAGAISLAREAMDLGELCRVVVDEHRLVRPGRVIGLDVLGAVRGSWDPERLGRVVSNLVGNALEHQTGQVQVRVRDSGERVVLEVENGGPPIDANVLPTLFEPFRRGDSRASGLGLGLYIVREIVQAHHGSVDVDSSVDGTTFRVELPKGTV
jgi:signal transduction histidine kinase